MNHVADNTSLQPSEREDLAWDAVNDDDIKVLNLCAEIVVTQYRNLPLTTYGGPTAAHILFALYRGIIGPAEIDTQVRELIAREASKLRRVK